MKNNQLNFNLDDFEIGNNVEHVNSATEDDAQEDMKDDSVEDTDDNDSDSTEDESQTNYSENADDDAIAAFEVLKRSGLYDEESFDGTWESIETQTNTLQDKVINSVLGSLPENVQPLIELAILEGEELTVEKLQKYVDTLKSDDIDTEDISEDDAREKLQAIYQERGMSTKAITRMLDALEDNDELLDELKTELEKQKENKKESLKQEALNKKKEIEEEKIKQKEYNNSIIKSLKDTGWKEDKQRVVVQELQTMGSKIDIIRSNPKALVDLADVLTFFTKDGFDRNKFLKSNGANSANTLKENAIRDAFTNKSTNIKSSSKQKSPDDLDSYEIVSPLIKK